MVLIISAVPTVGKISQKAKLVTCTYTDVHKGSNVKYVVVNLAPKKIFASM